MNENVALPSSIAVDRSGNRYIASAAQHRVFKVDLSGQLIIVAGNGAHGYSGDSGAAIQAGLNSPQGVAVNGAGQLYVADFYNNRVRLVDSGTGTIATVAGSGTPSYSGDGGAATQASLCYPFGVAVDGAGQLYIADIGNHRIRRVDSRTGIITTVAGNGTPGYSGDGRAAPKASLNSPQGVAVDDAGQLYVADFYNHRIRRVDPVTGIITTVAGNGTPGYSGDGRAAPRASLCYPYAVAVDGAGQLYIADIGNHRIRRVDISTGIISSLAGNGTPGFSGDGGPAIQASLGYPSGVAVDHMGQLYIADTGNHRIRRVDPSTGIITTVASTGTQVYSGNEWSGQHRDRQPQRYRGGHADHYADAEWPDGLQRLVCP